MNGKMDPADERALDEVDVALAQARMAAQSRPGPLFAELDRVLAEGESHASRPRVELTRAARKGGK